MKEKIEEIKKDYFNDGTDSHYDRYDPVRCRKQDDAKVILKLIAEIEKLEKINRELSETTDKAIGAMVMRYSKMKQLEKMKERVKILLGYPQFKKEYPYTWEQFQQLIADYEKK